MGLTVYESPTALFKVVEMSQVGFPASFGKRYLAMAVGSIDDELGRRRDTGEPRAKRLPQVNGLFDRHGKVGRPVDRIVVVEVVGPNTSASQRKKELAQRLQRVFDEHLYFRGNLHRMIDVEHDKRISQAGD